MADKTHDHNRPAASRGGKSRGKPRASRVVGLVAAALVLGGGLFAFWSGSDGGEPSSEGREPSVESAGEPVPDLVLTGLRGGDLVLSDLPAGPIVLNFYASWCPPCVAEMRDALGPVHRALGDEVPIVGIAMQDTRDGAIDIAEETDVDYRLVEDPDGEAFRAFGAVAMPATIYVQDGAIVGRHNGTFTRSQFEDQLNEFLGVDVPDAG